MNKIRRKESWKKKTV